MRHSKHRRTSRPSRNHPKDLPLGRGTRNAERVSFCPLGSLSLCPRKVQRCAAQCAATTTGGQRNSCSAARCRSPVVHHGFGLHAFQRHTERLDRVLKMESPHHFPHFSSLFNMHTARAIGVDFVVRIPVCHRQEQLPSPTFCGSTACPAASSFWYITCHASLLSRS